MRQESRGGLLLLIGIISLHILQRQSTIVYAATTFSIYDDPAWSSLKYCAKGCICCKTGYAAVIQEGLGCSPPWPNSCFCDTDRQDIATSFLSSCISSYCEASGDVPGPAITSAASVYGAYCAAAGYPAPGRPAITTAMSNQSDETSSDLGATTGTTSGHNPEERPSARWPSSTYPIASSTAALASGSRVTSALTMTRTSDNAPNHTQINGNGDNNGDNDSGAGLARADKIAIGLAIGIGLPASIAAVVSCVYQIKDRSGLRWPLPMLVAWRTWRLIKRRGVEQVNTMELT